MYECNVTRKRTKDQTIFMDTESNPIMYIKSNLHTVQIIL